MKTLLYSALTIIIFACSPDSTPATDEGSRTLPHQATEVIADDSEVSSETLNIHVSDYLGYVVSTENIGIGDAFEIFDANSEVVDTFHIKDEYSIVALLCLEQKEGMYKVVYHDEEKYVSSVDGYLRLESWEDHILSIPFVDFDPLINPIHSKPENNSSTLLYDPDSFYEPKEIIGEWLRISYDEKSGWVRWKIDDILSIELFYFA